MIAVRRFSGNLGNSAATLRGCGFTSLMADGDKWDFPECRLQKHGPTKAAIRSARSERSINCAFATIAREGCRVDSGRLSPSVIPVIVMMKSSNLNAIFAIPVLARRQE